MDHRLFSIPYNALAEREALTVPRLSRHVAVFVDISGYTHFAEDIITNHRSRGMGQLVDELERILVPTAAAAVRHRGNIVAVEGDALLITFDDSEELLRFCDEIQPHRRAVARTRDASYPLMLDIGVSHGRLYEFVAGDSAGRVYIAAGSALRGACAMEKHSRDGNIALSFPLRGATQIGDHYVVDPSQVCSPPRRGAEKLLKVLGRRGFVIPLKPESDAEYTASFTANLPPNVHSQLLSPVIAFADLPLIRQAFSRISPRDGAEPEPSLARDVLNELYLGARDIVERQAEGLIVKFKDEGAMFLFGAPRVVDDAPMRAFESMLRLDDLHGALCDRFGMRRHRICCGMHRGDALCGLTLGRYDAVGSSANLAARIKESAVRADASVADRARGRRIRFSRELLEDERVAQMVRSYTVGRQHLQGLEDSVSIVFDFSSMLDLQKAVGDAFVLREEELGRILALTREHVGQPEAGALINVIGELGSGKDRLLQQAARELEREQRSYMLRCSPFHRDEPYRALLELMKQVSRAPTDEELCERAIGRAPRSDRDFAAVLEHFRKRLQSVPVLVLFNNGENIDRESATFFAGLAPQLVAAGSVVIFSGTAPLFEDGERIELPPLDSPRCREFARAIAARNHPGMELEPDQLDEIHRASAGNPLFVAELVRSMREREGKLVLVQAPGSLRDVLLRKTQQAVGASPALRDALERYSLMHSVPLMAPLTDREAETHIATLARMGFLGEDGEFINDMLRTAVRDAIDPRRREALSAELSAAAEQAGLEDHLALFEYYRQGPLNGETRRRALELAAAHLDDPAHAAFVRDGFYDDLLEIADVTESAQRTLCALLLLRRAGALARGAEDEATALRAYELGKRAHELLRGGAEDCFALSAMAAASSRQALLRQLDPAVDAQAARSSVVEALRIFEEARENALQTRQTIAFWQISTAYADSLARVAGKALNARVVLQEAERKAASLPGLALSAETEELSRAIDCAFALAAIELAELDEGRWNLELARDKAARCGADVDLLRCAALDVRLLLKQGDPAAAVAAAREALSRLDAEAIDAPEVALELNAIVAREERRSC